MSPRTNENVARLLFDNVISGRQLGLLEEIIAPDAVNRTCAGVAGPAAFHLLVEELREAAWFPKATVLELVGVNDEVVAFWTLDGPGTDRGPAAERAPQPIVSVLSFIGDRISGYRVVDPAILDLAPAAAA